MKRKFLRRGPLGLRWSRLREWRAVLAASDTPPTLRQWREMLRLTILRPFRPIDRRQLRRDYRTCRGCPFHGGPQRTCLLCGCYMPFKIAAGGRCAARETDPNSPIGY